MLWRISSPCVTAHLSFLKALGRDTVPVQFIKLHPANGVHAYLVFLLFTLIYTDVWLSLFLKESWKSRINKEVTISTQ